MQFIKKTFQFVIVVLAITMFCWHCGQNANNQIMEEKRIAFSISKEIKLPLDSFSQPQLLYFQVLNDDTLKFVFYNSFNQSFYLYDFFQERLIQKINLYSHKGNVPSNISAFYILNIDTIFLFPQNGNYYFLCNRQGAVYSNKIIFVDNDDLNKVESHFIHSSTPVIRRNENIYINNLFGWVARENDQDKFLLIEYNYKKENSNFFIHHPSSIYDKNYENSYIKELKYTLREYDNTLLYTFNFDPNVYEYRGDPNDIKSGYCAPPGFTPLPALNPNDSDSERWMILQSNFSFSTLLFDNYKNAIIRIGLTPYNYEDMKSGLINSKVPKRPVLYIFDKSYNFKGEITLPANNRYLFSNIFCTKEGIWMQKITDDEENIIFELIDYEI